MVENETSDMETTMNPESDNDDMDYDACHADLRDRDDDYDDYGDDAELAQDIQLERQELEDFEGLNGPFDHLDDGGEW